MYLTIRWKLDAYALQLVPRESAVFGLAGDRENQIKLIATHCDMCRFDPSEKTDKNNYFLVEGNIAELCDQYPGEPGPPTH